MHSHTFLSGGPSISCWPQWRKECDLSQLANLLITHLQPPQAQDRYHLKLSLTLSFIIFPLFFFSMHCIRSRDYPCTAGPVTSSHKCDGGTVWQRKKVYRTSQCLLTHPLNGSLALLLKHSSLHLCCLCSSNFQSLHFQQKKKTKWCGPTPFCDSVFIAM